MPPRTDSYLASRLAAEQITPSELAHLAELHEQTRSAATAGDLKRVVDLSAQFHESVARAGRSNLVLHFIRQLDDRVRRFPGLTFSHESQAARALHEHDQLLAALAAHDADAAERLAKTHLAQAAPTRLSMPDQPKSSADVGAQ